MSTVSCPKCGRVNRSTAKFCGGCGTPLGVPGSLTSQTLQPAFAPTVQSGGTATRMVSTTSYVLIALGIIAGVCVLLAVVASVVTQVVGVNIARGATSTPTTAEPPATPPAAPAGGSTTGPTVVILPTAAISSTAAAPFSPTPLATDEPIPSPTGAAAIGAATAMPPGLKVLGDPWETDGTELNLINLDIRDSTSYDSAAVHAWFAFLNKTGQRILVEIDWSRLYVEDSKGNRYSDNEGAKTDSTWVDPGKRLDFDRNYTLIPGQKSRIPSDAQFVTVVVDKFSRLANIRWRYDINPQLEALPAPPASAVKPVGTAWEQNGIQLSVTGIDVRTSSYDDAAFRVAYKVSNRTDQRVLLEVDYADSYVVDSYGVRFMDYDGGGYDSVWLDPGKDLDFDRSYSTRAGQRSRISPGAEYVLVYVLRFSRIQNAVWQFDIVR